MRKEQKEESRRVRNEEEEDSRRLRREQEEEQESEKRTIKRAKNGGRARESRKM